jgi:hypothetical protein
MEKQYFLAVAQKCGQQTALFAVQIGAASGL